MGKCFIYFFIIGIFIAIFNEHEDAYFSFSVLRGAVTAVWMAGKILLRDVGKDGFCVINGK